MSFSNEKSDFLLQITYKMGKTSYLYVNFPKNEDFCLFQTSTPRQSPLSFYPRLLHKIKKFCYCKTMDLAEKIYAAVHKNPSNAIIPDDFGMMRASLV